MTSPPVKLAAASAVELFIETVACAVAASIIEDMKNNREPSGKIVQLFRKQEENNNVQLHNQSEQTETTSG